MKISTLFIRNKILKLLKENSSRDIMSKSWEDVNSIIILGDSEDYEFLNDIVHQLHKSNKTVTLCLFTNKKQVLDIPDNILRIDINKDTNSFFIPNQNVIDGFVSQNADLIIDLTYHNNYISKYLLLNHPSSYRCGIKSEFEKLYDLSISITDRREIKQYFEQILFYLKNIRSK